MFSSSTGGFEVCPNIFGLNQPVFLLHQKVGHQLQGLQPAELQGEIFRTFLAFCGMQYLNSSFLLGGVTKGSNKCGGSPFMSIHKLFKYRSKD